jgi:hypothetical protein
MLDIPSNYLGHAAPGSWAVPDEFPGAGTAYHGQIWQGLKDGKILGGSRTENSVIGGSIAVAAVIDSAHSFRMMIRRKN